ncbi:MAG: hypothetical protein COA79_22720 [Planctomycetota bacterium]|nr:hypothetical protein [Bacteroidia bacterium]PCJ53579.1 MAG: hypothetical protein COA79_22720 [Planctomycetota bacterium]
MALIKKLLNPLLVTAFISLMLLSILAHIKYGPCQTSKYHFMMQYHWLPNYDSPFPQVGVGEYKNYTGVWNAYFDNGNKVFSAEYINGEQIGVQTFWHWNGVKKSEKVYKDGAIVSMVEWDESGKLK